MRFNSDGMKSWPVAGVVLGLVLTGALSLAYWEHYQDQQRYLQRRNFRLLSVLASQVGNLVDNRARIVVNALQIGPAGASATPLADPSKGAPAPDVESWLPQTLASQTIVPATAALRSTGPPDLAETLKASPQIAGERNAIRVSWVPADPGAHATVSVTFVAAEALRAIFAANQGQGAFDTLVLATPTGHVVHASGARAGDVDSVSLAGLVPPAPGPTPAAASPPPPLGQTIAEQPVRIAGVDYRMFVQPCCRGRDERSAAVASSGLVVIGLAQTDAMSAAALAISPVIVLVGIAFVLAAVFGWSFLKMALVGPQQRVTQIDAALLAAAGVSGVAVTTILLLTTAAYARLSADVDDQLAVLASTLNARFDDEVANAYQQTDAMTEHLVRAGCLDPPSTTEKALCVSQGKTMGADFARPGQPYPGFSTFALIDADGMQRVKVAHNAATSRYIDVKERGYFQAAATGSRGAWPLRQCPKGCVLESHWSWTTGEPQVVLSMPTGIAGLPVAALSIPMKSLLAPVLPNGFAFAIIDETGLVQFHSDRQRNVHEDLLVETDRNPRLRSVVNSHRAGVLNTSYWGRPHRAYVVPAAAVPGWSVVALYDKQLTRAVVLEWTAVSLLLQVGFMVAWIIGVVVALKRGIPWMWPDPLRRPWYSTLGGFYGGALLLWGVLAWRADVVTTAVVGVLLPAIVWFVTYAVLSGRPPGVGRVEGWSELCRDYRRAGALLLLVTAAVPGASFFALSYHLHIEGFIKHRLVLLARALDGHLACNASADGGANRNSYANVFYGSVVTCRAEPERAPALEAQSAVAPLAPEAQAEATWDAVDEALQGLPYLTSAAVDTRGFLRRDRAQDSSWVSNRPNPTTLEVNVASRTPRRRIFAASHVPASLGVRTQSSQTLVWLSVAALLGLVVGVSLLARAIVSFVLRHVLLAGIVEPMRANEHVVTAVGQHLLVACDDPAAKMKALAQVTPLELTPVVGAVNPRAAWRAVLVELAATSPVKPVVIPDLTDDLDDLTMFGRKLALIEQLMNDPEQTVVVLSRVPLSVLATSAREASQGESDTERWPRLIARLILLDHRNSDQGADRPEGQVATIAGWRGRLAQVVSAWTPTTPAGGWRQQLLDEEGRPKRALRKICDELGQTEAFATGSLTRDQILEEIEDRAAALYLREWQACDNEERVVLEHVARHGLASAASRRVVRRLLVKGLLRKDPELRLMNQSFRRFVLTAEVRKEVAALEGLADPSMWDRLRLPLGLGAVATLLFLLVTQREAFDATVAMAAGVTAALPTLMRLTTVLTQVSGRGASAPKENA